MPETYRKFLNGPIQLDFGQIIDSERGIRTYKCGIWYETCRHCGSGTAMHHLALSQRPGCANSGCKDGIKQDTCEIWTNPGVVKFKRTKMPKNHWWNKSYYYWEKLEDEESV